MTIFNPHKKMTLTWSELCRMYDRYLDQVIAEREKEKKDVKNGK